MVVALQCTAGQANATCFVKYAIGDKVIRNKSWTFGFGIDSIRDGEHKVDLIEENNLVFLDLTKLVSVHNRLDKS